MLSRRLRASLIPPLLLSIREGAERGISEAPGNWERIERPAVARVPANPSLLRNREELSALLLRLAHKHPGWVRLRFVWLSSLPPCQLLPPALVWPFDRVVRLVFELELSKPQGKAV